MKSTYINKILVHLITYVLTAIACGFLVALVINIPNMVKGDFGPLLVMLLFSSGVAIIFSLVPYLASIFIIKFLVKKSTPSLYVLMGSLCGIAISIFAWSRGNFEITFIFGFVGMAVGRLYYFIEHRFFGEIKNENLKNK